MDTVGVVEMLHRGTTPDKPDGGGQTPLRLAIGNVFPGAIALLRVPYNLQHLPQHGQRPMRHPAPYHLRIPALTNTLVTFPQRPQQPHTRVCHRRFPPRLTATHPAA